MTCWWLLNALCSDFGYGITSASRDSTSTAPASRESWDGKVKELRTENAAAFPYKIINRDPITLITLQNVLSRPEMRAATSPPLLSRLSCASGGQANSRALSTCSLNFYFFFVFWLWHRILSAIMPNNAATGSRERAERKEEKTVTKRQTWKFFCSKKVKVISCSCGVFARFAKKS